MNISLKQGAIELALKEYIQSRGIIGEVEGIEFTAGRSANGLTVEIELADGLVSPTVSEDVPTPKAVPAPAKTIKPSKVKEPKAAAATEEPTPEPTQPPKAEPEQPSEAESKTKVGKPEGEEPKSLFA